ALDSRPPRLAADLLLPQPTRPGGEPTPPPSRPICGLFGSRRTLAGGGLGRDRRDPPRRLREDRPRSGLRRLVPSSLLPGDRAGITRGAVPFLSDLSGRRPGRRQL